MSTNSVLAPGRPGTPALWALGAKTGVGTAVSAESPVWFTLGQGILNEIYFPFVDTACTRDLGMLVTNRHDFFSEEKTDTDSKVSYLAAGIPAFHVVNTCKRGRYRIEKTVLTDPRRPTVLQQIRFVPLQGQLADYALFVLLNPHLGNQGAGNTAWLDDFKGMPLLFAQRENYALALACSSPWRQRSAGYVGVSDGWQDISRHKEMTWTYQRAEDGNVALLGEVDLQATDGAFLLALGFGQNEGQAGHRVRASLLQGFEAAREGYIRSWQEWQKDLLPMEGARQHPQDLYRISGAVMRIHEAKSFQGGIIASLAIPWGFSHGDGDMGYHLVWARDMSETVGGKLAMQKHEDARRVLFYLEVTQNADGHWPQNMFLDGRHFWDGIQLDETAFVILMVHLARREGALSEKAMTAFWPMVRKAASYLVQHGPLTPMDRWEEEAGYFASTMPVAIAALLAAADLGDIVGEKDVAVYLRETADAWNAAIDRLLYVTGTELARRAGVDGYYVRFALPDQMANLVAAHGYVNLKNHPPGQGHAVADIVSPDALCLVRFGLRAADDPRILNTVRVIDLTLKVDLPHGPCWHRYTDDGYGEHADGEPFDGTGIGRVWPLLTGERGHYELAAGRRDEAERLLRSMEGLASDSGLFAEQVWDAEDIPERGLFRGKPSGSAMPLVWAHSEYVKLRRSLREGRVFDMPPQPVQRYLVEKVGSPHVFWRLDQQCRRIATGKVLRVEVSAPAVVHWSVNDRAQSDVPTRDTGLGLYVADLPTERLPGGAEVSFTFRWLRESREDQRSFQVDVEGAHADAGRRRREPVEAGV